MIKICFLIIVLIIHALNIPLECIERKHVFQNRREIFQFIAEENDRLEFCNNSETLVGEPIF